DLPSMAAANFALAHATATASDAWGQAAVDTVDAIARSSAWSAERGLLGCDPQDQGRPCRLDAQAEWVHLLTRVAPLEARPAWRDLLATAVAGLTAHFLRPDGHWRPWSDAPRLVLVDASARAARALLAAADLLEDPALATRTIDTLDALAAAAYARAAGVAHLLDAEPRGPMLLTDAMLLAHALLDADPWRGESTVYRDLAEEILRTTVVRLQDDSGAVRDRVAALAGAGQVGRLADPHFPLDGNAEAARLIRRLFPDDVEWLARARRMLVAISGEAAEAGVYAAPVGLAWHALGPSGEVMAVW
ncbi:MAG: hypothetical protein ACR2LU_04300, partial [Luteitalea sp.]